jgi:predicted RNA-binding protein YlqC (UPF0109 family)
MEPTRSKPTNEEMCDLVRELAGFYVGSPENVGVRFQEAKDGSVYFAMRGSPEDDSRLVGRAGCHVNALTFLIERAGAAQSRAFTFRLITHPDGASPMYGPRDVLDYDPRPARDLLCRWLSALGVEDFSVEIDSGAGPRRSLFFNFDVKIRDRAKAESLTHSAPHVPGDLSVVGALGTIFRAIAKQSGVRFQIRLVDVDLHATPG